MTTTGKGIIQAAGGLLWRQRLTRREIAIVYRKRHNDWTLPKWKLNDGESWLGAALREVREETRYDPSILSYAGAVSYQVGGRDKVVRFRHMTANGSSRQNTDQEEVEKVVWLPARAAVKKLQYPLERALLEASLILAVPEFACSGRPKFRCSQPTVVARNRLIRCSRRAFQWIFFFNWGRAKRKGESPSEISGSTIILVRLSMAVVASLAASILLASGV
jgi:8-oxo-dGTP diphosphatase